MKIKQLLTTRIAIATVALILLACRASGDFNPHQARERLLGSVHTVVTEHEYPTPDGAEEIGIPWRKSEATFDANGNRIEEVWYSHQGGYLRESSGRTTFWGKSPRPRSMAPRDTFSTRTFQSMTPTAG